MKSKDQKFIEDRLNLIMANLSGLSLSSYMLGDSGHMMNTVARDLAYRDIEKIVWQVYKRGLRQVK